MPREATIGPAIFEEVNKLVAEGKTRSEAFAEVGKARKSRPGTVSANYYRVARQKGQGRKHTRTSTATTAAQGGMVAAQRGRRNGRTNSDGDLAALAKQIRDLTDELVRRVEERDRAIKALLG